jgi:hypothetical protein
MSNTSRGHTRLLLAGPADGPHNSKGKTTDQVSPSQPHQMKAGHAISAAPAIAPVIASAECAELLAPLMLSDNPLTAM